MPDTRGRLVDEAADVAPEEQVGEILGALREPLQVTERRLPSFRVPRPQCRPDHCLEQIALPVGGRTERAQVTGVDPEAPERLAGSCDVGIALDIDALPLLHPGLEQPELL